MTRIEARIRVLLSLLEDFRGPLSDRVAIECEVINLLAKM